MVRKRSKSKNPLDNWKALGFKPEQKQKNNVQDLERKVGAFAFATIFFVLLIVLPGLAIAYFVIKFVPRHLWWLMLIVPPLLHYAYKRKVVVLKPFVPKVGKK